MFTSINDESYTRHPFITACEAGDIDNIKIMISSTDKERLDEGFINACFCGHIEVVKLLIAKGVDGWNKGLMNACYNGHIELVKLLISHGANDLNEGLNTACLNGHAEMAKFMIEKGADDFKEALVMASYGENINIKNMLIIEMGIIPENYILSGDQVYFLYKSGVTPSSQYKSNFDSLRRIDNQVGVLCDDILIKDLHKIVIMY